MPDTVADLERRIRKAGGKTVVVGAESTYGFLSSFTAQLNPEVAPRAHGATKMVTIATGAISSLPLNGAITVDGTGFVIRDVVTLEEDDALTAVLLGETS